MPQKGYDISDMDIITVGLVEKGAVDEPFFLLKADGATGDGDAQPDINAWDRVRQFVRKTVDDILSNQEPEQVGDDSPDEEGTMPEEAVQETAAQKNPQETEEIIEEVLEEQEQPTVADALPDEVVEKLDVLQKSNEALRERLEKAEKVATEERERRERREWLEKAQSVPAVPVKPDELAEQLHYLAKEDPDRAEWWMEALKAVGNQLTDAGLFTEQGTSETPEEMTTIEKAKKLVEEGEAESIKEALMNLPPNEARGYLLERRRNIALGEV